MNLHAPCLKRGEIFLNRGAVVVTRHYNRGSALRAALEAKRDGLKEGPC